MSTFSRVYGGLVEYSSLRPKRCMNEISDIRDSGFLKEQSGIILETYFLQHRTFLQVLERIGTSTYEVRSNISIKNKDFGKMCSDDGKGPIGWKT